jgi:hypothetical protein
MQARIATFLHHSFQFFGFALLKFLCLKEDLLTFFVSSSHNSNSQQTKKAISHCFNLCLIKTLLRKQYCIMC